jgi:membrane associated rhomboid family serine protease
MLLLPTAIEDKAVRGFPWATAGLVILNVLVFVVSLAVESGRTSEAAVLQALVEKTLADRPYLAADDRLAQALDKEQLKHISAELVLKTERGQVPAGDRLSKEQRELDALVDEYMQAVDRLPGRRFGFVPSRPSALTALTSMFMHGGWLHLIGNMLFLYVSGACIEGLYGRTLFLVAYLLSGFAAVAGQYFADPASGIALVGASGAIAGLMGIVLVRLFRASIKFLLLPIPFVPTIRIPLTLPAFVVLPFWFLQQLWSSAQADSGGVAWWAHIAGFVFGGALAGAVMLVDLDKRPRAQRAAAQLDDADAWRERYETALEQGNEGELGRALIRLLDLLPRRGESDVALGLIDEGDWERIENPSPRLLIAIAAFLEKEGRVDGAVACYERARALPSLDPAWKNRIDAALAKLG